MFVLFLNSINNNRVREMFSLEHIREAVKYRRALHKPEEPRNLWEAHMLLENPDYAYLGRTADDNSQLYQGIVGDPGHETLLFVSERLLEYISEEEVMASDATFLMCPYLIGVAQIFIVAFFAFGKIFPLSYGFMSRKTTEAYCAIIKKLRAMGLRSNQVITDWESAERKGWKMASDKKSLKIWGCLRHHDRAVLAKAKKLGLGMYLRTQKVKMNEVTRIIKLTTALPYLPHDKIKKGYRLIKKEAKNIKAPQLMRKRLDKFLKYIHLQWMTRINPEELSVYGRAVKVTSGQESLNRRINSMLLKAHPSFLQDVDLIKNLEQEYWQLFQDIRFDGKATHPCNSSVSDQRG